MSFDVNEIRSIRFPGAVRGYSRDAVDEAITRLTAAVEQLQDSFARLEEQRSSERASFERELEARGAAHAELEQRLRQTTAEREQLARAIGDATRERDEFVATIEQVKHEREARASYTERLEQELARYRELEQSLTGAIVAAERSGNDVRAHADREAALIVEQARSDARKILFEASSKRERLLADVQRIRVMLAAAQEALVEQFDAIGTDVPDDGSINGETAVDPRG